MEAKTWHDNEPQVREYKNSRYSLEDVEVIFFFFFLCVCFLVGWWLKKIGNFIDDASDYGSEHAGEWGNGSGLV